MSWGVHQVPPRSPSDDLLVGVTGLSIQFYLQLRDIRRKKKTKLNQQRVKGHGWSLEEIRHKFLKILSLWSYTGHTWFLQWWTMTTCGKCCLPEKLTRNSETKVFTGAWSFSYPLPGLGQNSRLQKGKVFSINHSEPLLSFRESFISV